MSAFDLLFVFGLYVAPVLIAGCAVGLLALATLPHVNRDRPTLRRVLLTLLLVSCAASVLLGAVVRATVD